METQLMTLDEVAEVLRQPASTLRYWRHVGKGPRSFKIGRRVMYRAADVEQFLADVMRGVDDAALSPTR